MTESESVALPLGDTPKFEMGWVVGFEPTYTGATTLGLNHLTIPTMLVFFTSDCVALSRCGAQVPSYIPLLAPSAPCHKRKILRIHTFVFFTFHCLKKLATWNGLEPSTSSVTGWHSNQLNYQAIFLVYGGSYRARTCDPLLVRQMLSQLS